MTEENLYNETEIRRFLLGEMPEDARAAFEENFIADESLFEQISVAEDELIESYVRGMLSSAEKTGFEKHFLAIESRRRRVVFTRTLLEKSKTENQSAVAKKTETVEANSPVWKSLIGFFKTPKFAFGAAFAVLLSVFGVWFFGLKSSRNEPEIVKQITPTPTIQTSETIAPDRYQNSPANENPAVNANTNRTGKISGNQNAAPNTNRNLPDKNQNINPPKENAAIPAPILALFAGGVRAEGKMPELNLPKTASGANLQLNLESRDYKTYQVEIVDPDGRLIFKNNKLRARNSKVNLFVPAQKLQTGDYLVKLSGFNRQNENESIADYTFRVKRR